jgi:hypothetical protein
MSESETARILPSSRGRAPHTSLASALPDTRRGEPSRGGRSDEGHGLLPADICSTSVRSDAPWSVVFRVILDAPASPHV